MGAQEYANFRDGRNEIDPKLCTSTESKRCSDRCLAFSFVRAEEAVRWPPNGGQPEPTFSAALRERSELEAPAAGCILQDCSCGATNGRCASMMRLEARPNV